MDMLTEAERTNTHIETQYAHTARGGVDVGGSTLGEKEGGGICHGDGQTSHWDNGVHEGQKKTRKRQWTYETP